MQKQGFTLVELIVVITILAVLGTIAFVSFQGYAVQARDSTRISDLTVMKKALELYKVKQDSYPSPSETSFNVSYSGGLVWKQGVFADSVLQTIKSMGEVPTDPLTGTPYTFSRLNTQREFQLGAILEKGFAYSPVNTSYAAGDRTAIGFIVGSYNGRVAQVQSGSTTYVLAVPTIISGAVDLDYQSIVNNNSLVYKGGTNLPTSYETTDFNTLAGSGNTIVNPNALLYQGNDLTTLTANNPSGSIERQAFLSNLQAAYSGTVLVGSTTIAPILSSSADENIASTIINNTLGGEIPLEASSSAPSGGGSTCIFGSSNIGGVHLEVKKRFGFFSKKL